MRTSLRLTTLTTALALATTAVILAPSPTVASAAPPDPATVVTVPDPHLRACLERAVGVAAGTPLTAGLTQSLTTLTCRATVDEFGNTIELTRAITGLDGFDFANLTSLDLGQNGYGLEEADLTPLARLYAPRLTQLDLSQNALPDIAAVAFLTELRQLNLRDNLLTDIRPLARLGHLGEGTTGVAVDLSANHLTDLSPLGGASQLTAAEVAATDQLFEDATAKTGTTYFRVTRPDGSAVPLAVNDCCQVSYDPATATLTIGDTVALLSWDDGNFAGEAIFFVNDPYDPRSIAGPRATSFTLDLDVLVVAGGDRDVNWVTEQDIYDRLDGALDYWADWTGLSFSFGARQLVRYKATADECRAVPNGSLPADKVYSLMGTTRSHYDTWNRILIVLYDVATCDQGPGTGGFAQTSIQSGYGLGHGGVIYLPAPPGIIETAHELGHIFGLSHANRRVCQAPADDPWREPASTTIDNCSSVEYGDVFSVMGSNGGFLTSAQRFFFGLIRDGAGAVVLNQPGVYTVTLDQLSVAGGGTEAAVLFPPYYQYASSSAGYTVELRPYGTAGNRGIVQEGGVFLTAAEFQANNGYFQSTSLIQPSGGASDRNVGLPVGQTATLAQGQIRVTVVSQSEAQAVVRIVIASPRLAATASAGQVAAGGGQVAVTVDSAIPWTLAQYPDWITPDRTRGPAGTSVVTLTADANADATRTAELVFTQPGRGTTTVTVDVVQATDMFSILRDLFRRLTAMIRRLIELFG
jgi:hypothetical protein